MRKIIIALCILPFVSLGDLTVEKARFGSLKPSHYVVTNITDFGSTVTDMVDRIVGVDVTNTNGVNRYGLATTSYSDLNYLKKGSGAVGSQTIGTPTSLATININGFLNVQRTVYNTGGNLSVAGSISAVSGGIYAQSISSGGPMSCGSFSTSGSAKFGDSSSSAYNWSVAEGFESIASGVLSHAAGYRAKAQNTTAWVWQGTTNQNAATTTTTSYFDHGAATFNINPEGGVDGVWIGETNLATHISNATNGLITAPIATNAANAVVSNYLDYALTNLTAETLSLRSGEIGNYETTSDFTLALQFSDNGRSGDCLLYVANTDAETDHTIDITPNTYKFVSADIEKARTLGKATTNLVMFTRLKSDTVLVSKQEVK